MKDSKPKVMFCMPLGGQVPAATVQSLINIMSACTKWMHMVVGTNVSCYVHKNRNELIKKALKIDKEAGLDYVFFFDADMKFDYKNVMDALTIAKKYDVDIYSGSYFSPIEGEIRPIAMVKQTNSKYAYLAKADWKENTLLEVDAVGFGFVLLKMSVLRKMTEKFGTDLFDFKFKKLKKGEDIIFCAKAQSLDYKIYLDTANVIGHVKGVITDANFNANL